MLLEQILSVLSAYWYLIVPVLCAGYLVQQKYHNGLNKYPGPFLASFTDLWRAWLLLTTRQVHKRCIEEHQKRGDIVRLGPNLLSFADPKAIKDIYGLNKGFVKVGTDCAMAAG